MNNLEEANTSVAFILFIMDSMRNIGQNLAAIVRMPCLALTHALSLSRHHWIFSCRKRTARSEELRETHRTKMRWNVRTRYMHNI